MVEQIAQVDSTYLIGGTNWVGMSVPLHCAALGKVLLAYGAADLPRGRLERRTEQTLTSRAAIEADLAAVRERGYAVTVEELEPAWSPWRRRCSATARRGGRGAVGVRRLPAGWPPAAMPARRRAVRGRGRALSAVLGYDQSRRSPEGRCLVTRRNCSAAL